jgi:hypothetical protein
VITPWRCVRRRTIEAERDILKAVTALRQGSGTSS